MKAFLEYALERNPFGLVVLPLFSVTATITYIWFW